MNSDALKSMLGQITTAILAILVATGVMSGDDSKDVAGALTTLFTSISAAIPAVLLLVNLAASAYRHYGMKKVPEKAVALELPASAPPAPSVGQENGSWTSQGPSESRRLKEIIMLTRRKLLGSAAPAAALAVAGCATMPDISAVTTNIIGYVQQAVAAVASYVPVAESIAATAASLFGPQWSVIVTMGSAALNTLIQALESVVTQVAPATRAHAFARLRASSPYAPVVVGVVNGVAIYGYH